MKDTSSPRFQAPKVIRLPFPLRKIKELNHVVSDAPPVLRLTLKEFMLFHKVWVGPGYRMKEIK